MLRDDDTLLDIAHAARLIHTFIQGMTQEISQPHDGSRQRLSLAAA
ncbi:MAG: hypothetical protein M3N43_00480 [Actinomycetota bacterium]|nr:hypothetical protein [Actinomycetota bacterium]